MTTDVLGRYLIACRRATIPGRHGPNILTLQGQRAYGYAPAMNNRRLAAVSARFTFMVKSCPGLKNPGSLRLTWAMPILSPFSVFEILAGPRHGRGAKKAPILGHTPRWCSRGNQHSMNKIALNVEPETAKFRPTTSTLGPTSARSLPSYVSRASHPTGTPSLRPQVHFSKLNQSRTRVLKLIRSKGRGPISTTLE